jgi:ApbE superfamily uncharacterized protein (UPF0280 family)
MLAYKERSYRKWSQGKDLVSFQVAVKQTDLWVSAERDLSKETRDLIFDYRYQLETYIEAYPEFVDSLAPQTDDPYAPPMIREMIQAGKKLRIGPMASVAGAIAQHVGEDLLKSYTDQVIVENGGDIFLKTNRPVTVSIFGGNSPWSERIGLRIPVRQMPLGVCSSSGTVGHSMSMGDSDVVSVLAPSAALADAAATALGNRLTVRKDLQKLAQWAKQIEELIGGVAVLRDAMAGWGDIDLVEL